MFSGSFKESTEDVIKIREIDADVLEVIVKFLYCGIIEIIDLDTAVDYFRAAHFLKVQGVISFALEYMQSHLAPENCVVLWLTTKSYDEKTTSEQVLKFAASNFHDVLNAEEFVSLDKENLVRFATAVHPRVDESIFAKGILSWLDYDQKNRTTHFTELLQLIDVTLILHNVS